MLFIHKITQGLKIAGKIKHLSTTAQSIQKGIRIVYPNHSNHTHQIYNPLETFISSLAGCTLASVRAVAIKRKIHIGQVIFRQIKSDYDQSPWFDEKAQNGIKQVKMEVQAETYVSEQQFQQVISQAQHLCPIHQMMTKAGISIRANWKVKKIDSFE